MISSYFLTNGVSGLYVGWVPDFYGRRQTLIYSLGASLSFQMLLVFHQNYYTRIIAYIGMALCNVKNGCAFAWLFEMSGAKNK